MPGGLEGRCAAAPGHLEYFAMAADLAAMADLSAWLDALAARLGLAASRTYALQLCAEELVANTILHGLKASDAATLSIRVGVAGSAVSGAGAPGHAVRMVVEDNGPPFNPTAAAAPTPAASLAEAQIGGQGLALVRHFSQALHYQRHGDWNRVELVFAPEPPASQKPAAEQPAAEQPAAGGQPHASA